MHCWHVIRQSRDCVSEATLGISFFGVEYALRTMDIASTSGRTTTEKSPCDPKTIVRRALRCSAVDGELASTRVEVVKLLSHLRCGLENLLRQSLDFTAEIMPDFEGTMKLVRELKDKKTAPAALEKLTALIGDKALEGVLVQVRAFLASKAVYE